MSEPISPRFLDISTGIAGAYATLLLHQAGAEVVRAEPVDDDLELPRRSPLAAYLRQGQANVRLGEVAPWDTGADIVLVTPTTQFDRDAVLAARAVHPGVVLVAISPYGLTGPWAARPASDLTLQADSGALAIRGVAGAEPIQMGGRTIQWLAGAYAAAAGLAMWRSRRISGEGNLVDLSLAEVANTGAANFMDVFHAVGPGVDADPVGPPRVFETPSIERTADGWVGFNTNAPHQITSFLRMMGRDDLADTNEFTMAGNRTARIDEWQSLVTAWTSQRTTAEIIDLAVAHQVPVAPVCDGRTVTELDHVIARHNLVPEPGGRFSVPNRPWRINGMVAARPLPAPDPTAAPSGRPEWKPRPALATGPNPGTGSPRPLAGLRVLDLTAWWAGPSATAFLAALGADVIHVEGPARMDGVRMVGAMFMDRPQWWERSPFFLAVNVNKRDLALDLTSPRGREIALQLVEQCDVVVENFTPRVLDKIGLGWDAIRAANPRTILVRMPAFGLDGPWTDRPGFAQNIEQATGLAWLTGQADDQPRIQRGPCDPNGGVHSLIALLGALDERERTGEGSMLEVALFDAALPLVAESIIEFGANGVVMMREGNRCPQAAPQGVYRCLGDDAWLALSVASDAQWKAFASSIGRDDLADEARLATLNGRREHHDELDAAINAWSSTRDLDQAVTQLAGVGVPAAPAREPRLTARHPQFRDRGYQQVVQHAVVGPLPVPTLPFRVDGVERWVETAAPCFGAHTDEVLTELLGLGADELAALRAEAVIADRPIGF